MSTDITVIEVYESAAEIGRDLEKLIDAVGSDLVVEFMPKVIRILEQLELCVKQREIGINELQNAQEELRRMKHIGAAASEENLRLIMDVKQLDAQRQNEIKDWMVMSKELEQQNKRLKAQLSEKEGIVDREKAHEQEALQVLYQFKETVDNQRDQLRTKDDELKTRALEVDALQQHVDRLAKVTADLRRKNELLGTVAKNFIQEKSELQSELRAIGKEKLPEHHGIAGTEVVDGGRQQQSPENGATELETEALESVPAANIVSVNMEGKAVIDLSDPNRPRFTLQELQTVLQERDELKLDIMELEDELKQYRPKEDDAQLSEADQKPRRSDSITSRAKGEASGIKKLFSFLFRGKNSEKLSTTTEEEGTWEFLEKSDVTAGAKLTVPDAGRRAHANTIGSVEAPTIPAETPPTPAETSPTPAETSSIPEENPFPDERPGRKGKQRSKSYTGPPLQVSYKEPLMQFERRMCIRTNSNQLVELGQDVLSERGSALNSTPTVSAAVSVGEQAISRNNSNSRGSVETTSVVIEQMTIADRNATENEAIGQRESDDSPKSLNNNNDCKDAEMEM